MHTEYKYERRADSEYGDSRKNASEFIEHLRMHWRLIAAAGVSAIGLSLLVSVLLPKHYTATAIIVIEPPAGNDVRTATAVSPVYLESLRTYERFAESDTLFAGAVEHFHLANAENARSVESLKQQVLKVTKLRDTKILDISATLRNPELAQKLVNYVAEETVKLSRGESAASDREVIGEAERQAGEAQERLDRVQKARIEHAAREPSGALQPRIEADVDLLEKVRQALIEARSDIAEYQERPDFVRELPGLRAKAAELEKRAAALENGIEQMSSLASRRAADREKLESELKMAQTARENSTARLRELRMTAGTRGERLRVIDPGVVPQRPSSPNVPLNVIGALLLTMISLIACLTISFAYRGYPG